MTEDTSWKDKYLRELEDAEQRAKAWEERIHALERMLVRTCLAAEGQDSKLDDALAEVRALVRQENAGGSGWQKLQDRIDRRISHLDELREKGEREHKRSLFGRLLGCDEPDTATETPEDPVPELQPGSVDLDTGEEDCTDQRLRIARRVGKSLWCCCRIPRCRMPPVC